MQNSNAVSSYPRENRLYDPELRQRKGAKVLSVLQDMMGQALANGRCLDVGCASGLLTAEIAPHVGFIVGVEYDIQAIRYAEPQHDTDLLIMQGDAEHLPFADASFDVVICAQVYEHVQNAEQLFREIYRVLTPTGICFFSGPNRWSLIEEHYGLPFLSWLPRSWASSYVRLAQRGSHYAERPLSYWKLRRLLARFHLVDYTLTMIKDPARFHLAADIKGMYRWATYIPRPLLWISQPLFPNYNWVLSKSSDSAR